MAAFRSKKMCCFKRDNLHLKNTPDVKELRRMRQKRRIPWLGGGGGYMMATQAIFPPPQWRIQDLSQEKVVKSGWFRQTRHLAAGSKPAADQCVLHQGQSRDLCKSAILPPNPQRMVFARNLFNIIDAETSYFGDISVKIHLTLLDKLWNKKRHVYSKLAQYTPMGGGGGWTSSVGVTSF